MKNMVILMYVSLPGIIPITHKKQFKATIPVHFPSMSPYASGLKNIVIMTSATVLQVLFLVIVIRVQFRALKISLFSFYGRFSSCVRGTFYSNNKLPNSQSFARQDIKLILAHQLINEVRKTGFSFD
jgi:hypothetical protein